MIVKLCGITTLEDALAAADCGADMIGLNFYPRSPRYLAPELARRLCGSLRERLGESCPALVGVFVNDSAVNVRGIIAQVGLDFAQLSGDELPEVLTALGGRAFKGVRPSSLQNALDVLGVYLPYLAQGDDVQGKQGKARLAPTILVDAYHPSLYGGTGAQTSAEIALLVKARVPRMMLAGGLTPENVAGRVREIQPWGVDVASGVEIDSQPGVKDPVKMKQFVAMALGAAREAAGGRYDR